MFLGLPYFSVWRDMISNSKDIDNILEQLTEREFPLNHKSTIQASEIKQLSPDQRTMTIGITQTDLPLFVFEKNLGLVSGFRPLKRTEPTSFFDKLMGISEPNITTKFSRYDNNILLGANEPDKILELITACGFTIRGGEEDIYFKFGFRYFAVFNERVIHKASAYEIMSSLTDLGAELDNFRAQQQAVRSIPPEQRRVIINGEYFSLPQFIYQAKITPLSPIMYGNVKPYWLVLGALTTQELQELVNSCNLDFSQADSPSNPSPSLSLTRQVISDDVQIFVWNRDGGKCVKCGSNTKLEFDHIIPISKGGSNTARNIQLLCERCNRA